MLAVPVAMGPQSMSISSRIRRKISLLDDSFIDGEGLQPKAEPRPVVNAISVAPEATCPVAEQGSKPGLSMKTRPRSWIGSAYSTTSFRGDVPPLATAPSDFSRIVVRPPDLFPGEGLLFISAPWRSV